MDTIISFLLREVFLWPIIFIMVAGILVVPFATPASCVGWIWGNFMGRVRLIQAPVSFFLCIYGLGLTVGIWFINPSREAINAVVDSPVSALGIPGLVMVLALMEQRRLALPRFWGRMGLCSSILAGLALYWMALAATMSAAV